MAPGNSVVERRSSTLVLLAVVDFLLTSTIAFLTFSFLFQDSSEGLSSHYLAAIFALPLVLVLCSALFHLYDGDRPVFSWNVFRRMVFAWFVVIASLALLVVMTKTNYSFSRGWFVTTVGLSFLSSLVWRVLAHRRVLASKYSAAKNEHVLAIGEQPNLSNVVDRLTQSSDLTFAKVHLWEWQAGDFNSELLRMQNALQGANVTRVWVAGGKLDNAVASKLVKHFNDQLVQINYYPDVSFLPSINSSVRDNGGLVEVSLSVRPLRSLDRWFKSVLDLGFAAVALLLLSPFMLVISIGVKLSSPGPVFYRQERVTENGKHFEMLKFRSMPAEAEDKTGPVWAKAGENRATRFGSFLRKSSLDELPQFINVLRGEMSVVGPRPERPIFVEKFQHEIPAYMQKHYVKAGITGWAQVHGLRGNTSLEKRIQYDLFYIENWSAWLDLKIIIMTVFKGLVAKNAY